MVEQKRLKELLKEEKEIEKRLSHDEAHLKRIKEEIQGLHKSKPMRVNWSKLAVKYITESGVLLSSGHILDMVAHDTSIQRDGIINANNEIVAISVALNNLCENGVLRKLVVQGIKGHFYGLPEWFNKDDTIDNKYLLKVAEIINRKTKPVVMDKKKLIAKLN